MRIKIRVFGNLIPLLGDESIVELEANSRLKDLIYNLSKKTYNAKENILGQYDASKSDLVILLNGTNIYALNRLETPLKEGDVVTFLPPLVGG